MADRGAGRDSGWGAGWDKGWDKGWGTDWEKWAAWPGRAGSGKAGGATLGAWGQLLERTLGLVKERVVGRSFTVATRGGDVDFTLTELETEVDPALLRMGRLDDVRAEFAQLTWRGLSAEFAEATLGNVQLRGKGPELVAAPVQVRLRLSQADVDRLLAAYRPEIELELGDVVVARWQRHPEWGHLEVEAGADGTRIWIRPRRLVRGTRGIDAVRRLPPISFRVGLPADRVTVLSVEARSGALEIRAQINEFRAPLSAGAPERFLRTWGTPHS